MEEFVEMIEALRFTHKNGTGVEMPGKNSMIYQQVKDFADGLKAGRITADIANRGEFLDAIADQVVTAVGVGHTAYMKTAEAVRRVDESNWTKLVGDKFVYTDGGKIAKPPTYQPPNLEGLY